ncbi:MAG: YceI family protein [Gammaproteobacteria bacterium]
MAVASSLFCTLGLLAACAGHKQKPSAPSAAPPPLTTPYAAAAHAGASVYRLDSGASTVYVLVDKAGGLSGLGHRHVITVGGLRGFAQVKTNGSGQADLRFPVTALVVDPAAALKIYKHYSTPGAEDVAGTRDHMLGPVLDSIRYPWVTLHIQGMIGGMTHTLETVITLHGTRRILKIDGKFTRNGSRLTAQGNFSIKQSAFGITPYSIMLGALRVQDTLQIRYHLTFKTWCTTQPSTKGTTC